MKFFIQPQFINHPAQQNSEKEGNLMENSTLKNKSLRTIIVNGIIMAIYIVLSLVVQPVATGPVQFRISESLNHLVVFNRKMMWGVVGGVMVFNLFFGYGVVDMAFGGAQTFLALGLTAILQKVVPNVKLRLALNTFFFTVSMFFIAIMLNPSFSEGFWGTYLSLAISELATMTLAAPIMYYLNKKLDFTNRI